MITFYQHHQWSYWWFYSKITCWNSAIRNHWSRWSENFACNKFEYKHILLVIFLKNKCKKYVLFTRILNKSCLQFSNKNWGWQRTVVMKQKNTNSLLLSIILRKKLLSLATILQWNIIWKFSNLNPKIHTLISENFRHISATDMNLQPGVEYLNTLIEETATHYDTTQPFHFMMQPISLIFHFYYIAC